MYRCEQTSLKFDSVSISFNIETPACLLVTRIAAEDVLTSPSKAVFEFFNTYIYFVRVSNALHLSSQSSL